MMVLMMALRAVERGAILIVLTRRMVRRWIYYDLLRKKVK
jgi:hypothetical protein